jgi:hypothetical protein
MGGAEAAFIEDAAALVTEGRSFEPFDAFLGAVAALLCERFAVSLGEAARPVREAADRHLTGGAEEVAFNRFTEHLGGLVAERLGEGPGDEAAAEAVYELSGLAAGGYLWPEDGPVRSADPRLDGWVAP